MYFKSKFENIVWDGKAELIVDGVALEAQLLGVNLSSDLLIVCLGQDTSPL